MTTRSPFPASIGLCHLRFWFFMHGSDRMGTLKVTSSQTNFSSVSCFWASGFFFFFNCHLLRNDPKWRLNLDLSEISFLFYSAYQHILLCLLSVTWYPKEGMNVFLPANNPSKHVRLQTSLSYQSFHVFLGLFVKWVNFKTTNNKHLLKALLRQEVYSCVATDEALTRNLHEL